MDVNIRVNTVTKRNKRNQIKSKSMVSMTTWLGGNYNRTRSAVNDTVLYCTTILIDMLR